MSLLAALRDRFRGPALLCLLPGLCVPLHAEPPAPQTGSSLQADIAKADSWARAKFLGRAEAEEPGAYVVERGAVGMLARDTIQGHALRIAGDTFAGGVALRSAGVLEVHLPTAAKRFQAEIGVDSNDLGYYSNAGRGNVYLTIRAQDHQLYRSPTMHEGQKAIPVDVDLGGATTVSIELNLEGEKRPKTYSAEWDEMDLADAAITLVDGAKLSLSGVPAGPAARYTVNPPFSFRYGDRSSREILNSPSGSWGVARNERGLDDQRTELTSTYRDSSTGLTVRCVAVVYKQFPVVEWTVYLRNGGTTKTPIIENLLPLDSDLQEAGTGNPVWHHSKGSNAAADDFEPLLTSIEAKSHHHAESVGGRPSDGAMPYFNLDWGGHGVIIAVGWPGQWTFDVDRQESDALRVAAGQQLTHFSLLPGEEVRTPLIAMQFWHGDWEQGQNVWRRWMRADNLPKVDGAPVQPLMSEYTGRVTIESQFANEQNQLRYVDDFSHAGVPLNIWWIDAGWYPFKEYWPNILDWKTDPARFPRGLRPISDRAHAAKMNLMVWFEPERVYEHSWLAEHHPEWLIGPAGKDRLLFLGNKEAWQWLVDRVTQVMTDNGIDYYRQDFNFPPLDLWRSHDAADRQGITEIEHVEGYLAFFDELHRRFPHLLIDTCASGGRRLDLETLRRAVPLWRSDHPYEPVSQQMMTYGLSYWLPYFGDMINTTEPYAFRSQLTSVLGFTQNPDEVPSESELLLRRIAEWRETSAFYSKDFYPLTPYSPDHGTWMAWQFNAPEQKSGAVQVFRREGSPFELARLRLKGLDEAATYEIKDEDGGEPLSVIGKDLMGSGLAVTIAPRPGAKTYIYRVRSAP